MPAPWLNGDLTTRQARHPVPHEGELGCLGRGRRVAAVGAVETASVRVDERPAASDSTTRSSTRRFSTVTKAREILIYAQVERPAEFSLDDDALQRHRPLGDGPRQGRRASGRRFLVGWCRPGLRGRDRVRDLSSTNERETAVAQGARERPHPRRRGVTDVVYTGGRKKGKLLSQATSCRGGVSSSSSSLDDSLEGVFTA